MSEVVLLVGVFLGWLTNLCHGGAFQRLGCANIVIGLQWGGGCVVTAIDRLWDLHGVWRGLGTA